MKANKEVKDRIKKKKNTVRVKKQRENCESSAERVRNEKVNFTSNVKEILLL